jgi:sulfate transport system substrate-binding protein
MSRIARATFLVFLVACSGADNQTTDSNSPGAALITLGAYTTPREAYAELLPLFAEKWRAESGQEVTFEESYLGSGAQSRAIVEGFEADVAALSLEPDVDRIQDAGLITHDWKDSPTNGMVSNSVVAFAVRPGNPKGIADWEDLAQPGLEVLTPNPKTSGGAMWNVLALYGAALRGHVHGFAGGDETAATNFLKAVLANVTVMDKGARESITTFEAGVGDVAITYENEVLVGQAGGQPYELVIPKSTILVENPIALIDTYADEHGTRVVASRLIEFLASKEAQEVFARHGLRSVDAGVAAATADQYPVVDDLFTIEELGGWDEAVPRFFGDEGIFSKAIEEVQGG